MSLGLIADNDKVITLDELVVEDYEVADYEQPITIIQDSFTITQNLNVGPSVDFPGSNTALGNVAQAAGTTIEVNASEFIFTVPTANSVTVGGNVTIPSGDINVQEGNADIDGLTTINGALIMNPGVSITANTISAIGNQNLGQGYDLSGNYGAKYNKVNYLSYDPTAVGVVYTNGFMPWILVADVSHDFTSTLTDAFPFEFNWGQNTTDAAVNHQLGLEFLIKIAYVGTTTANSNYLIMNFFDNDDVALGVNYYSQCTINNGSKFEGSVLGWPVCKYDRSGNAAYGNHTCYLVLDNLDDQQGVYPYYTMTCKYGSCRQNLTGDANFGYSGHSTSSIVGENNLKGFNLAPSDGNHSGISVRVRIYARGTKR